MKTTLIMSALCLAAAGACAQEATPAPPAAPSPSAKATPAPPAPKPATNNPNVVVLRSETKFWNDAALNKPVSLTLKDADANAAVTQLARVSGLPMSVIQPPPPRVVNPPAPAPAANGARPAATAAPQPVPPPRATLEVKNKPVREVMQTLAGIFNLSWRKDGATYVLKDMNFVDTLNRNTAAPVNGGANNTYNNRNQNNRDRYNPRGPVERAPGVYVQLRRYRR